MGDPNQCSKMKKKKLLLKNDYSFLGKISKVGDGGNKEGADFDGVINTLRLRCFLDI